MTSLLSSLRAVIGVNHVIANAADMAPYLTDWRKRYVGRALAVVQPGNTDEVAAVVRLCAQTRTPIVPQGGNTGLVGGATPDDTGHAIVLSLLRLNTIRDINTENDTLTAEAGCILQHVQHAAVDQHRLFPLSLAAEGTCTIGGNIATNAGGTQVLRYGSMRDLTLGLEVVLPNGEIWHGLRGLRKDNTGYDLRSLFVGAEGTLGVVTAATLKLYPLPCAHATALVAVESVRAAVSLLGAMREAAGPALTAFELMSAVCLQRVAQALPQVHQPIATQAPWYVLVELSDHEAKNHVASILETCLTQATDQGTVLDATLATSITASRAMWRLREAIPEAHTHTGGNVKHDISLPISAIASFVENTNAVLQSQFSWIQPSVFGHLGDGNLHYNMTTVAPEPVQTAFAHQAQVNQIVHDAVAAAGGSISAEHGLGQMKRIEITRYKSKVELDMMRAVKQAIDPLNIMNPGKVL